VYNAYNGVRPAHSRTLKGCTTVRPHPERLVERLPVIRGDRGVVLRSSTPDDVDALARWFGDRVFVRWWGGVPIARKHVQRDFIGSYRSGAESIHAFIIECDGTAIGFAQAWKDDADRDGGIDIVLVPEMHGQGIGPAAIRALACYLVQTLGWARVTADPSPANRRSIRAFEKAGFVVERRAPDPTDAGLLMVFCDPPFDPSADTV